LIAVLVHTGDMVELLLDALDRLTSAYNAEEQPTHGDIQRLREHSALWRQQLDRLPQRLNSVMIERPTRPQ
jgi:hypothetical protein